MNRFVSSCWLIVVACLQLSWLTSAAGAPTGPLSPHESMAHLDVAPGLELTLFAHEPMVVNPTNIDIDRRGRVWVTEGANYRRYKNLRPQGDRIVILEDTTGDGRADTSKVFYQDPSIDSALGICVLGKRVIVSRSPNVFVFTDEDGDDVPDRRELLFTGISGEQHDHGVHAAVFGPDGRLYFNFGNNGKQLLDRRGQPVIDLAGHRVEAGGHPYRQGMVFRCELDGSRLETLGHNFRNNYELAVDSFGTLWQSDNDDDGNRATRINFVMEFGNYGYRDEMSGAGWRTKRDGMHTEVPLQHWHLNDPGVVPNLLQTGAGSPTGICIYEGDLLPAELHGQMIHCDAGPNVVRAYPTTNDGAGYSATVLNLIKGRDQWFRPADVCVAADGSVFVADWYDAGVGGHDMADHDLKTLRGRIYRLAPPGHRRTVPEFDVSTAAGAVHGLKSPNHARRFLAWQALSRMGEAAEQELVGLWRETSSRLRARALPLLARVERGERYLSAALDDPDPNLRVAALRTVRSVGEDRVLAVGRLLRDPSPQVRRECAIALRHLDRIEAPNLWADLALQHDGTDRWYLEALGIGADRQEDQFFAAWLQKVGKKWNSTAGRDIVWRSRASGAAPLLARLVRATSPEDPWRSRLIRALDFHSGPQLEAALATLLESDEVDLRAAALVRSDRVNPKRYSKHRELVDAVLGAVRGQEVYLDIVEKLKLGSEQEGVIEGVLEVLVAHADASAGARAARWLLDHEGGSDALRAAVSQDDDGAASRVAHALGGTRDRRVVGILVPLVTDEDRSPTVTGQAARAMVRTKDGAAELLMQVRSGRLPEEIKPLAGMLLHNVRWDDLRRAAASHLPPPLSKNKEPLPSIRELTRATAVPANGRAVYEKNCAECHQVNGFGKDFGPNLSEIGDKLSRSALFRSVLDPNAGISFNYEGTIVSLRSGDSVVGIVQSETSDDIEVKLPGGIVNRYAKTDVTGREPLKTSIMPAGLQAAMTKQELIDLVAYLTELRKDTVGD